MLVPRSVKRKYEHATEPVSTTTTTTTTSPPPAKRHAVETTPSTPHEDDDDEPIKRLSSQQRLATIGSDEPICVICSKYGEYINDDTDHDVCSLECKGIDTRMTKPTVTPSRPSDAIVQPYVADTLHAKLTNYTEPLDLASMTSSQLQLILKAQEIQLRGSSVPHPITSMDQCKHVLSQPLIRNLDQEGLWGMATPVQRLAVPSMLAGRDVIVVSPSSSGKTTSFLIPLVAHCQSLSIMHEHKRRSGPYALVLAPTRDLCVQIESTLKRLVAGIQSMRTALLVGGIPVADQLYRLRKGVQIVVGTPGRVTMIASSFPHMLRLWRMHMVVLDEADVLLQQAGLRTQTKEILDRHLSTSTLRRQTAYFSSSPEITKKAYCRRLVKPIEILVGQVNEKEEARALKATPPNVKQTVLWVENASKAKRLLSILDDPKYFTAPVVVFVDSGLGAEYLKRSLLKRRRDWRIAAIVQQEHSIDDRKAVIEGMNQDPPAWDVVIATDTLARGIDLPHVSLVINYDMASSLADYIQRISRAVIPDSLIDTSKRKRGWAITFINKDDKRLLPSFAKFLSTKSSVDVTPIPNELKHFLQNE
ncbi:hypothetical protein O0I10_009132 [Lichtheimia ornata]|uniref:RNA helicase n=1 Tax=Lichtheimia ornata TaxID=688661 RepID=A0AAD7XSG3_9FUNG|nr:uncharacterized protein O0I10_009132 [Lichtheimia ornata]KAJ8655264.1 hypothetical protein O0I10_009132 [Lichtheimia ornata]